LTQISQDSVPHHIGIIMDGNGRWAQARGLPRTAGHRQGAETVKNVVKWAKEAGVKQLTLFAFSLENWNRPEAEVSELMGLLRRYLKNEASKFKKENACLRVIGDRTRLDDDICEMIEALEEDTKDNQALTIAIAISYGGRDEIFKASQGFARTCIDKGLDPDEQPIELFEQYLMTHGLNDPDLIIRTSGEKRISNFLLWQSAYAEYYFSSKYWPEFDEEDFNQALAEYKIRDRRFGRVDTIVAVS